jgi:hypothetical protein
MKKDIHSGDIVKIPFDKGWHTYARRVKGFLIAVYDCRSENEIENMDVIISKPTLFFTYVYKYAFKRNGKWQKVGRVLLREGELLPPDQFIQDIANSQDCVLLSFNGRRKKVTPIDCIGLERASVWTPEQVEMRLKDFYDEKPNIYVERARVRL